MPDFLHKDETHDIQPEAGVLKNRPKREKKSKPQKPAEKAEKEEKKKKPSNLFVHYYGVLFLFLIAAFLAAGFMVLRPLILEFKMTNAEIEATVQTLKDERDYLDSLQRSIAAAETIPSETLARVDEALPRSIGIPKLLQTMSQLAERNRVKLTSLQFTEPKKSASEQPRGPSSIATAPLDISLTLSSPGYAETRLFLEDVERNLRVLDVQQITVTGNEQTGELSYTLQLRTYTLTAPGPAKNLGTAAPI